MPLWKRLLLGVYYETTRPYRRVCNQKQFAAGRAPIVGLYYHRIADDAANPWTTSNAEFRRHIDWLEQRFDLISLEDAQRRIRSCRNDRTAVTITFDDGYADNCDAALPLLIEKKIPFTYFVTTDAVLQGKYFEHDIAMGNKLRPNSLAEISQLADAGVEIGAHTRTHANLGAIDNEHTLYDEVVRSGEQLQIAIQSPIRYFAFPYGMHPNLNAKVFDMAHSAGFEGVCSAYGGYNYAGDDAFHIQRIGADGPLVRIKNSTTHNSLRHLKASRFEYETAWVDHDRLVEECKA